MTFWGIWLLLVKENEILIGCPKRCSMVFLDSTQEHTDMNMPVICCQNYAYTTHSYNLSLLTSRVVGTMKVESSSYTLSRVDAQRAR